MGCGLLVERDERQMLTESTAMAVEITAPPQCIWRGNAPNRTRVGRKREDGST